MNKTHETVFMYSDCDEVNAHETELLTFAEPNQFVVVFSSSQ